MYPAYRRVTRERAQRFHTHKKKQNRILLGKRDVKLISNHSSYRHRFNKNKKKSKIYLERVNQINLNYLKKR